MDEDGRYRSLGALVEWVVGLERRSVKLICSSWPLFLMLKSMIGFLTYSGIVLFYVVDWLSRMVSGDRSMMLC